MTTQKTELLAPAGNFEKLKIAIRYGADAVYLAGKDFSLRNFSGNFTLDELREAIHFAHNHHVRVYVACNIYSRNDEQDAISAYLKRLGELRPDAVIIADPGIIAEARSVIPEIPIHLSTQANTTNYKTALFWEKFGIRRINLARELSLKEIKEIADKTSLEIEAFVHGSMCISYSGRCLLSNFMANRESNRGRCCHPCRFNYAVVEEKRPGQYFPLAEDDRGTYIFNSKDLCMLEQIPAMIESGIGSLKIEGRMKGISYVASTVKIYREAIDAYYANPENYVVKDYWHRELSKINYRGYCTGFYMGEADQIVPNYEEGLYYSGHCIFVGKVISVIPSKTAVGSSLRLEPTTICTETGSTRSPCVGSSLRLEPTTICTKTRSTRSPCTETGSTRSPCVGSSLRLEPTTICTKARSTRSPCTKAVIEVRNKIFKGDAIEILTPEGPPKQCHILDIINEKGDTVLFAQPNSMVTITLDTEDSQSDPFCSPDDLISGFRDFSA